MGFCNSCGKPIVREDYGTNKDGSLNDEFCKDCFQDGEYTEPDITLNEMIVRKTKEMMAKNPRLAETEATSITVMFIPGLKRWNPDFNEEEFRAQFP